MACCWNDSHYYFQKTIIKNYKSIINAGITKAKFGPVEIEREINILSGKVDEQKIEQEKQKSEIETLRFLISNFVSDAEFSHLEKLVREEPFPYEKAPYFEVELRRLRSLGLIKNCRIKEYVQ